MAWSLGKDFLCPASHGLCLRLLAFPKNKVVASTQPLTCKCRPVPCGTVWFLGDPVALSVHGSKPPSLLPARGRAMWEWCFPQGPDYLLDRCYGLNCVPPPKKKRGMLKSKLPVPRNVTLCGDSVLTEIIKLK